MAKTNIASKKEVDVTYTPEEEAFVQYHTATLSEGCALVEDIATKAHSVVRIPALSLPFYNDEEIEVRKAVDFPNISDLEYNLLTEDGRLFERDGKLFMTPSVKVLVKKNYQIEESPTDYITNNQAEDAAVADDEPVYSSENDTVNE